MLTHLPPRLDTRVRSGLTTVRALTEAAAWLDDRRSPALVLEGDTGCGKSIAAAWCFAFMHYRARYSSMGIRFDPVWCDAPIVADAVAPWSDEWAKFDIAPLVVLDDVGTEQKRDRMTTVLERLFNVAGGRAIITTNLSPEDFSDRYGARVRSRVIGEGTWVACAEPDMRLRSPSGAPFREYDALSAAELAENKRAADERERIERESMSGEEIGRMADKFLEQMNSHVSNRDDYESDSERREFLCKQVAARKAAD